MKPLAKTINAKGQDVAELALCIPLLFFFAAGLIQFTIIFLSYVQFEHACGEAARQYAAGIVEKNAIEPCLLDNLGYFRRFFDPSSLKAQLQKPLSPAANVLENTKRFIGAIPLTLNYDGAEWKVVIRCTPPFFFGPLFPKGIPFETTFQVYRYPP